ncbi:MAG: class I SAM-dependent methyltransferase [Candidatus Obscuribacterales bacterium]|nr:class I SAM-dependent methyltransferase [Candidatus Obscuribacterales bacterium]
MQTIPKLTAGTGSSVVVERCQLCDGKELEPIIFLGYLPPVNTMPIIGSIPKEEPAYPALVLSCKKCSLVQLGLTVDPNILFPPEYPYTSGTTKILRDNFAEMYKESQTFIKLGADDLAVDIGSNDGTLLSNFKNGGHRVKGIEPTLMANLANERGIPTERAFFGPEAVKKVVETDGKASVITATNVFAHIENVHQVVESILDLLKEKGVFISESHYWLSLVETLQYDTIYHEHLRYYSLSSLRYLLEQHGLEIFHVKRIPTHGGSIRVYAARKGDYAIQPSVKEIEDAEKNFGLQDKALTEFKRRVVNSKLALMSLLHELKKDGARIVAVGAPSRASTLVNYVGLDEGVIDAVLEIKNSYKIGKYMPGTLIPVRDENLLFEEQPDYALLLSWHIAGELIANLKAKGYKGKFIVPLPEPKIVSSEKEIL